MTRDLTQGSPIRLILAFAVPTFLGMLFQQFYSVMDTLIVGQLLGADALGSVGSTGSIQFLVLGFCIGMCNGFAIPVAQRLGAKNLPAMRKYVWNATYLALAFALVLALTTGLLARQILTAMDTPVELFQGAYAYIVIIFFGIPACFLYNLPAAIIRSLGDSKTPVYFLALASLLNIGLDFVLIAQVGMGVEGAAIATIFSQAVSGTVCLLYMRKKFPILQSAPEERTPDKTACVSLCAMGIPMGLQYSITAIGSIILQTAVNGLGSACVSGVALAQKLNIFFFCPFDALGATMATYCGQNVGAGKLDRIKSGLGSATFLGGIYSVIALGVLNLFAGQFCLLFLPASEGVPIGFAVEFIKITSFFLLPLALVNIFRFSMQGMGFGRFAMLAGVMEMIARGIFGFFLVPRFGYMAACLASPAAWMLADAFLVPGVWYCINNLKNSGICPIND